ncbi:unnamed protein product [Fraxinus pennsylvanica]|uniref:HMA domain-containing protein n=1 Tax=Fraxinus pennsylvanica TaxID=56036 RepID=A0AAD2DS86_9LAMI|nr:unnamed protein product [Fraxinus pennsylvanica]
MSKEEFLKIQTCVLKVNVHCDGCKHKVKKILQKIEGVYTTNIDAEQGKVTVSGNVDPTTLIKKLAKIGKHAELWSAPKANNNQQNQLNNQFKNLQIGNGKGQSKNPNQKVVNPQPKGGQNPQHQQLKGIQDPKMPPQFMKDMKMLPPQLMKDMKMPFNGKDQNQKSVKFNVPEIDESGDDEFDDSDYDEFDDDDEFDDEMDDVPLNKMKPVMGNGHGGGQIPKMMMNNMMNMQHPQFMQGGANGGNNRGNAGGNSKMMMNNMMKGQHPQFMKGDGNGGGNNRGNAGGNGKKGGGAGNIPLQVNVGGNNDGKCGANLGKKGGNGNNNSGNQNQGGGKGGKNGGAQPQDGKNGGGDGGQNKNGNNVNGGGGANGAKKGGGMNDGFHGMPNMMAMNAMNAGDSMGQMGNMPIGQMRPMGNPQMGNFSAVQGIPTSAMNGGGGFQGQAIEHMAGNPHYQQQLAAMMMNQQRANGNERFQPMMYARPPPAVSYMPPYPPYPYPQHPGEQPDQYSMFSDENTSSCSVIAVNIFGSPRRCGGQGDILSGSVAVFLSWARQCVAEGGWSMSPTILGCISGSAILRKAAALAFENKRRSTLTSDIIECLGESLEELCPNPSSVLSPTQQFIQRFQLQDRKVEHRRGQPDSISNFWTFVKIKSLHNKLVNSNGSPSKWTAPRYGSGG